MTTDVAIGFVCWAILAVGTFTIIRRTLDVLYRLTREKVHRRATQAAGDDAGTKAPGPTRQTGAVAPYAGGIGASGIGLQGMTGSQLAALYAQQAAAAQMAIYNPNGPGWLSFAPQPQTPELKHEGIRVGEIVAWRAWRVSELGGLHSTAMEYLWLPECRAEGDVETAGVHAFKEPWFLFRDFLSGYGEPCEPLAYGTVWLWGEVVEHETGYRAQYAKVRSIEGGRGCDVEALRRRYCPEVRGEGSACVSKGISAT